MVGDGQVSEGHRVVKPNARKVRRIGHDGNILAGFAGATADALTLLEKLEQKLEAYSGIHFKFHKKQSLLSFLI